MDSPEESLGPIGATDFGIYEVKLQQKVKSFRNLSENKVNLKSLLHV